MALHQCAKNHDMMYSCEVMVWTNRYVILCQFLPLYPLHNLKNKTKTEKHLEILWFYTSVSLIIIICFIAELSLRTNRHVILAFFCPFAPLPPGGGGSKIQNLGPQTKKNHRDNITLHHCDKNYGHTMFGCKIMAWNEYMGHFGSVLLSFTHPPRLPEGWVGKKNVCRYYQFKPV